MAAAIWDHFAGHILLLTRWARGPPCTYLRLKQLKIRTGLFPGCQNIGTLCLYSVAMAVRGHRTNPPLAGGRHAARPRKVPEIAPQSDFLPSSRVRFFEAPRGIEACGTEKALGGGDHCRGGLPCTPLVPSPLFRPISLISRAELVIPRGNYQIPPAVGREACSTVKTPRKVEACGTVKTGSQKAPGDAISRKLRFWAPGAGTLQNWNNENQNLAGRHAKRVKCSENEQNAAKRSLLAVAGTFRLL